MAKTSAPSKTHSPSDGGPLIHLAILGIMAEVGVIEKTHRNQAQKYDFRGIDDVYAVLHPLLTKYGVYIAPCVQSMAREERKTAKGSTLIYTTLTVLFRFTAADGSVVEVTMPGEAMDSGDKSCNKAMSAAFKYAAFQLFCIPTNDPDADTENQSHDVQPGAQPLPSPAPQAAPAPQQAPDLGAMKVRLWDDVVAALATDKDGAAVIIAAMASKLFDGRKTMSTVDEVLAVREALKLSFVSP